MTRVLVNLTDGILEYENWSKIVVRFTGTAACGFGWTVSDNYVLRFRFEWDYQSSLVVGA